MPNNRWRKAQKAREWPLRRPCECGGTGERANPRDYDKELGPVKLCGSCIFDKLQRDLHYERTSCNLDCVHKATILCPLEERGDFPDVWKVSEETQEVTACSWFSNHVDPEIWEWQVRVLRDINGDGYE